MQLIELTGIDKIYHEGRENEVRALSGVSLKIDFGEFVAVVGSSGSGKSTMMNILGCLDTPTRGQYYLHGQLASALSGNALAQIRNREIGFIFQGYHLIPALDALENVELPLIYQGVPSNRRKKLAQQALERVDLAHKARSRPTEMSGGQQQRVAIARAIATSAPVLLADEPTGALDSKTGIRVLEILHQLHDEGATVILITHDHQVAATAERVVCISDGVVTVDAAREAVEL